MYLIQRKQFKSLTQSLFLIWGKKKKKVLKNVFVFLALSRSGKKERGCKKKGERRQHRALRTVRSQRASQEKQSYQQYLETN